MYDLRLQASVIGVAAVFAWGVGFVRTPATLAVFGILLAGMATMALIPEKRHRRKRARRNWRRFDAP